MASLSETIRSFNRFELKYLVRIQQAEAFKQALSAHLTPDQHGSYQVTSLYYDSPDHRFYWEKIDGIRFRRKLRLRIYEAPQVFTAQTPVFIEIKQRLDRVTQKRRMTLPYASALDLAEGRSLSILEGLSETSAVQDASLAHEVLQMAWQYDLRPAAWITYQRQALTGGDLDIGLRVTFDRDLFFRAHNLRLDDLPAGQALFPPGWIVIEIKVNERIPYWLTELVAQHNLKLTRMSKYCHAIEVAQLAASNTH